MPWELRRGRRYYYRGRRVNGKVVKQYFGAGPAAVAAAAEDAQRQQRSALQRCQRLRDEVDVAQMQHVCDQLSDYAERLLNLAYLARGYAYRRGEWRRTNEP